MTREERTLYYREWLDGKRQDAEWIAKRRASENARIRAYYDIHPEKKREQWRRFSAKHGIARRPNARMRYAKNAILARGIYAPRFNRRLPEWAPVGGGLDRRSAFLAVNLTPSQRAYARELAIERRAK